MDSRWPIWSRTLVLLLVVLTITLGAGAMAVTASAVADPRSWDPIGTGLAHVISAILSLGACATGAFGWLTATGHRRARRGDPNRLSATAGTILGLSAAAPFLMWFYVRPVLLVEAQLVLCLLALVFVIVSAGLTRSLRTPRVA